MALGGLMMLAFWGALIVGVVFLIRWAGASRHEASSPSHGDDPLTILRRRYAAGEIDPATFERMSVELGNAPAGTARQPVGVDGVRH